MIFRPKSDDLVQKSPILSPLFCSKKPLKSQPPKLIPGKFPSHPVTHCAERSLVPTCHLPRKVVAASPSWNVSAKTPTRPRPRRRGDRSSEAAGGLWQISWLLIEIWRLIQFYIYIHIDYCIYIYIAYIYILHIYIYIAYIYICIYLYCIYAQHLGFAQALQRRGFPFPKKCWCNFTKFLREKQQRY